MIKNIQNVRFTRELVDAIKKYVLAEEVPFLPKSSYYYFISCYSDEDFSVNKDERLFYQDREVIPLEDVMDKLEKLFSDPSYYRAATSGFYNQIISEFVGISRSAVEEFLKNKRPTQLFKKVPKREITPIVVHFPR